MLLLDPFLRSQCPREGLTAGVSLGGRQQPADPSVWIRGAFTGIQTGQCSGGGRSVHIQTRPPDLQHLPGYPEEALSWGEFPMWADYFRSDCSSWDLQPKANRGHFRI